MALKLSHPRWRDHEISQAEQAGVDDPLTPILTPPPSQRRGLSVCHR